MADLSDVQATLVTLISGILYPNGTSQPSLTGGPVKVAAGWPIGTCLDSDLGASPSVTNVSVFPTTSRNTTRYLDQEKELSVQTPTLGLVVSGQTVTVTGSAPGAGNPHNLCVFANGKPYVYQASATNTLATAAAGLVAAIAADFPGTSRSGAVITLTSSARIGAVRTGVTGTYGQVTRNQEQIFQIGIWAADPATRDLVAKTVDLGLSKLLRFTLPDTSICKLTWKNSVQSDKYQKQTLYRRDLFYACEYATVDIETATQITQIQENNSAAFVTQNPATNLGTTYE